VCSVKTISNQLTQANHPLTKPLLLLIKHQHLLTKHHLTVHQINNNNTALPDLLVLWALLVKATLVVQAQSVPLVPLVKATLVAQVNLALTELPAQKDQPAPLVLATKVLKVLQAQLVLKDPKETAPMVPQALQVLQGLKVLQALKVPQALMDDHTLVAQARKVLLVPLVNLVKTAPPVKLVLLVRTVLTAQFQAVHTALTHQPVAVPAQLCLAMMFLFQAFPFKEERPAQTASSQVSTPLQTATVLPRGLEPVSAVDPAAAAVLMVALMVTVRSLWTNST
jgi:hypothetical protein